jgi:glycerophosphoryl diester phosphodiesterase
LLLLGHRGARHYAPENSLPAFELALEHGCHGFEFDVRRTRDGKAVVCHDPKAYGMRLANLTYEELMEAAHAQISRGRLRDAMVGHTGILPLLSEVLESFAPRAFLDIEIKETGLEESAIEAVSKHPPAHGFVVSSFLPEVIAAVRRLKRGTSVGFITDKREHLSAWRRIDPDYVIPKFSLVGPTLVDEVHAAGKKLLTWTVNDARMMRRMAAIGVDGIISDDTRLLTRTLAGVR